MMQGGDGNNFSQAGYIELYAEGTHPFAESCLADDCPGPTLYPTTLDPGQWYSYNVTIDNNVGDCGAGNTPCWLDRQGNTVLGESFFPTTEMPDPWNVEMYAETNYFTSDVPGSSHAVQYVNPQYLGTNYELYPLTYYSAYNNDPPGPGSDGQPYWYRETGVISTCSLQTGVPCFKEWDGLYGSSPPP